MITKALLQKIVYEMTWGDPDHTTYIAALAEAKAALEAWTDEPETAMVDAAMVEMANIVPPLRRNECLRLIRAALSVDPAPAPRQPLSNQEIYTCYIEAANQTLRPQDERIAIGFARAIERAHGIGGEV